MPFLKKLFGKFFSAHRPEAAAGTSRHNNCIKVFHQSVFTFFIHRPGRNIFPGDGGFVFYTSSTLGITGVEAQFERPSFRLSFTLSKRTSIIFSTVSGA